MRSACQGGVQITKHHRTVRVGIFVDVNNYSAFPPFHDRKNQIFSELPRSHAMPFS